MLVLTRKAGESILIGDGVRITLVSSSGTHARIAIEAPDNVSIHRQEVFDRIADANREAAVASAEFNRVEPDGDEQQSELPDKRAGERNG